MIQINFEEALARLALDDPISVWIETVPNKGVTTIEKRPRDWVIDRMRNNNVWETGEQGQAQDMGIYVVSIGMIKTPGFEHTGLVTMYFQTKPECRLSRAQLDESVKRKRGDDALHSSESKAE